MLTAADIPNIIQKVNAKFDAKLRGKTTALPSVDVATTKLDDDWLYVCVSPFAAGVRASEYADVLSQIERELREERIERVLLVPTINEPM